MIHTSVRSSLFSIAVTAALVACGTDSTGGGDDGTTPDGATQSDGKTLFVKNCASCHGDGSGGNLGPTILNPVTGYATYVVRHGRNEMGFPGGGMAALDANAVTDAELTSILGYLGEAEKPATGAELYGRFCTNCHGADGRSGRVGKNIAREANNVSLLIRFGHGGTSYGSRTSYMPSWTATEITDAEVGLIRSYVSSL